MAAGPGWSGWTMCRDPDCDSGEDPPPGERWCRRRLEIEAERWFTGHRMIPGLPRPVSRMLDDDPDFNSEARDRLQARLREIDDTW